LRKALIVLVWQNFKAIVTVWTVPGGAFAWKNRKIIELRITDFASSLSVQIPCEAHQPDYIFNGVIIAIDRML